MGQTPPNTLPADFFSTGVGPPETLPPDFEFDELPIPRAIASPPIAAVPSKPAFEARPSDNPKYLAFPSQTEIRALPTPGIFDRAKEALFGGVRTGETLLGQAADVLAGDKPLLSVHSAPALRPEAAIVEPKSAAGNVARGVLKGVGEFTTPDSALMLTALGGATGVIGKLGKPFLGRLISAGFAADMIHNLYEREPEFRAAADAGDEKRVWELVGETLPTGAMAAAAASHSLGGKLRLPAADRPIPEPASRPESILLPKVTIPPKVLAPDFFKESATAKPSTPPASLPSDFFEKGTQGTPVSPQLNVGQPEVTAGTSARLVGPMGRETKLHTPAGENQAKYRVVEAESLQPSHDPFTFGKNPAYPEGVQERQYHSNKNAQAEVTRMGQNLQPELLVNSDPTAVNGPPQVTPEGIVLGGNARSMAVQRAYQQGGAEGYRKYLGEHAEEFGLSQDQIAQMKAPVLVREIADTPANVEGLRRLGQGLNKSFTKALSEVEEAVSAGKNVSRESAESIAGELDRLGDNGSLRSLMESKPQVFRDSLLRDGVLREADLPRYFTEQGTLNTAGKDFVENTLLGSVVRDADLLQSLPRSLTGKLERVIPQLIELGQRSDDWNIVPSVRDAAREIASAQARGLSIEDHLGQGGLFGGGPSPEVETLARILAKKPTEVAAAFRRFTSEARNDMEGQQGMFGPADATEAFSRIFEAPQTAASYGMAGKRPTLPSLQKLTATPELIKRSEILKKLAESLNGLPFRVGRFKEKALGIYKVRDELIRLKEANDIPVAMHETGHHLHKLIWGTTKDGNLNWKPLAPFRKELSPLATKPRAGQSPLPEGFAEYLRLYLTKPGEAQQRAPGFHSFFEKELASHPDIRETLIDTRTQINRYVQQPAAAKILSHISKEEFPGPKNRFDQLYTAAVDALTPVKRAVDAMAKRSPIKPTTETNAYELGRLLAGWAGKADHFLKRGTFDAETLAVTGKSLQQILKPVEGRLDDLRIYLVARRAIEKANQGKDSGIDLKDAKEALKQLDSPELKKAAEELYGYNDDLLRYLVKSKYLSQEQYEGISRLNQEYVPFFRVMETKAPGSGSAKSGGKSMADLWSPVKRMSGSTREIIDPLESIVKNTYTFINLAERNRVAQALVSQAKRTPGAGQWVEQVPVPKTATKFELEEIRKPLEEAGIELGDADLSTVAQVFRPSVFTPKSENILTVFENGERNFYQVHPQLYESMKGLDREGSNILVRLLSMPARALRLGATSLGPEFIIQNPIRDSWTAFIQSQNGFKPGVDTARGLFHALKRDELFGEWQRAGGEHAAMVALDRTSLQKNLDDMLASPLKWGARHPIEALRMISEYGEAATRLGEYGQAKRKGASPREAALASRDVTLDFARVGAKTQAVNSIIAFFNAQVQGTDKFIGMHKLNPKGTIVKAVAGVTLPSMLLYAINKDDEDYKEIPRWQKDFFWLVPTKGTPLHKETPFIPIPKPFLWGLVYGSAPERTLEWIDQKDPKAFDDLLKNIGQSAAPGMIPTAITPLVESYANRSLFTGERIVPSYLERLPAQYQAQPWTSEFSKGMAAMFAKAGIEVSPIKLDNAIFGYTGGLGRTVLQSANPLLRDGPEPLAGGLSDIPGLRALAVRFPSGQAESIQRFYERLDDLERRGNAEIFSGKYPGRIEPGRLSTAERLQLGAMRKTREYLSEQNQLIREITSSNLPPEVKRKRIDEAYRMMIAAAKNARFQEN